MPDKKKPRAPPSTLAAGVLRRVPPTKNYLNTLKTAANASPSGSDDECATMRAFHGSASNASAANLSDLNDVDGVCSVSNFSITADLASVGCSPLRKKRWSTSGRGGAAGAPLEDGAGPSQQGGVEESKKTSEKQSLPAAHSTTPKRAGLNCTENVLQQGDSSPRFGECSGGSGSSKNSEKGLEKTEKNFRISGGDSELAVGETIGNRSGKLFENATDIVDGQRRLLSPKACYVCKVRYYRLHHHYCSLCPNCAQLNWEKRNQVGYAM